MFKLLFTVLLACSTGIACAQDAMAFSTFTVVDMVYRTETDKAGGVANQVLKRFVIKNAGIVTIGDRAFINGLTPSDSKVAIEGSQWSQITLPLDRVVALVGVNTPTELIAKGGVLHADVGYPVDKSGK